MFAIDVTFTLLGQSARFWAGEYHLANEGNPLAAIVLRRSPWLFLVLAGLWAITLLNVLLAWRNLAMWWLATIVTVAHAFGATSWCVHAGGTLGIVGAASVLLITNWLKPHYPKSISSTSS
jgi:hypothetical protein